MKTFIAFTFLFLACSEVHASLRQVKYPKSNRLIVYPAEKAVVNALKVGKSDQLNYRVESFSSPDKAAQANSLYQFHSEVAHVEEDQILMPQWGPVNQDESSQLDGLWSEQWPLHGSFGIDTEDAWPLEGGADVVVAVLDTGISPHSDIESKLLPGYDFISDPEVAGDGDGRDNDPTDNGDWVGPEDDCYAGVNYPSSWHGTHVAGTIGSIINNGIGIAGVTNKVKIVPVRVLGKCGGLTSDIVDAMRWSAGLSVAGVPVNQNPAKIINLSLGAPGRCSTIMQKAINDVRAKGVAVVVAAGNSGANLNFQSFTPANCQGVITVASSNAQGDLSSFSNYGQRVDISAPGGESWKGVWSLANSGYTTPASESFRAMAGTSMAAPHAAGVLAMIFSLHPEMVVSQALEILQEGASPQNTTSCSSGEYCGKGLINAFQSLLIAETASTDGVVDSYSPAPVSVGNTPEQTFTVQSKSGGCGSVNISGGNGQGPGGGSFMLALLMGILVPILASKKKKA